MKIEKSFFYLSEKDSIKFLKEEEKLNIKEAKLLYKVIHFYLDIGYPFSYKELMTSDQKNEDLINERQILKTLEKKGLIVLNEEMSVLHPLIDVDKMFLKRILGESEDLYRDDLIFAMESIERELGNREKELISSYSFIFHSATLCSMQSEIKKLFKNINKYSDIEKTILMITLKNNYNINNGIEIEEFLNLVSSSSKEKISLRNKIYANDLEIFKDNTIKIESNSEIMDHPYFILNNNLIPSVFNKENSKKKSSLLNEVVIEKEEELFYNESNLKDVEKIKKILKKENLIEIQKLFSNEKIKLGLTIFIYGKPGTGKTSLVEQISFLTKRKLLWVDIPGVFNKFIGETEKSVKKIFADYESLAATEELKPILLMNEADALLSKRISSGELSGGDKTFNASQNILLEQLEKFDGILFATSNLEKTLDVAYERRFLKKIKLEEPDQEVRKKIWKSKIKTLNKEELDCLSEYSLTGGEIQRIYKEFLIDSVVNNDNSFSALLEVLEKQNKIFETNKVGFFN